MTNQQPTKHITLNGVRVHSSYFARPFNLEERLHHHMNQFSRLVSMLALAALFVFIAFQPDHMPALVHLLLLALCLGAIVAIGNQANKAAAKLRKRRQFESFRRSNVTYTKIFKGPNR